ncbi:MAG TPA: hypothetical protein VFS20_22905 [Longimicrobium sp.]|nr:hypothetical protein [Longimicrobium sp.]
MSAEKTADPAERLREAARAARDTAACAARVRREVATELERAVQRMELGAPAARGVENALSAQLARLAQTVSHPPRRWVRMGEGRVLAAAEALDDAVSSFARVETEVSAAASEQLRKRLELRWAFRRIPDLGRAAEQSRRNLGRAFQRRAVAAVGGRLTTSGRVLARLTAGRVALGELAGQLRSLLAPLERVRAELGFFACRGRAVVVPAAGGRGRDEVEIQAAPAGELMLAWDRHGAPRLAVHPARGAAWRDGEAGWRLCFSLPREDGGGRRLRIERPALATWTGEGRARLVRAGVLAWEERTYSSPPTGDRKPGSPEEG